MAKKKEYKPTGNPMGRPRKEACLDWNQAVENLAPWYDEGYIARELGVSIDTLCRRINEEYSLTFAEFKKQRRESCKQKLFHTQYIVAVEDKNPTLLIWLGKQNGQVDKQEQNITGNLTLEAILSQANTKQEEELKPE